jgi:hypothetical protein
MFEGPSTPWIEFQIPLNESLSLEKAAVQLSTTKSRTAEVARLARDPAESCI